MADGSPMCARDLRVVLVSTLEQRLASESEGALLTALRDSNALLTTVSTANVRCALVSYRQENQAGADLSDTLTIDGAALRGIVSAARSLKVDAVCARRNPNAGPTSVAGWAPTCVCCAYSRLSSLFRA